MSKLIHIGDVSLPLNDFVVARTGVLGITRSGKTYAAKGLAEQLLDHDVPVIISKQSGVAEVLTPSASGGSSRCPATDRAPRATRSSWLVARSRICHSRRAAHRRSCGQPSARTFRS